MRVQTDAISGKETCPPTPTRTTPGTNIKRISYGSNLSVIAARLCLSHINTIGRMFAKTSSQTSAVRPAD